MLEEIGLSVDSRAITAGTLDAPGHLSGEDRASHFNAGAGMPV